MKTNKLVPLGQGSSKQTGNISDSELARVTTISVNTIQKWKKTDKKDWRFKLYWMLKGNNKEELEAMMKNGEEIVE